MSAPILPLADRVQGVPYEWWDFAWGVPGKRLAGFTSIAVTAGVTSFVLALYVPQGVAFVGEKDLRTGANPLHVRDEALWCDYVCETRLEHWSLQVEAYGLGVASGRELVRDERGDRLGVGIDVEFVATREAARHAGAAAAGFVQPGAWTGEVLVGRDRWPLRAAGLRAHGWDAGWPGEGVGVWTSGATATAGGPAGAGLAWSGAAPSAVELDAPPDAPRGMPADVVPVPASPAGRRGRLDDGARAGFRGEAA